MVAAMSLFDDIMGRIEQRLVLLGISVSEAERRAGKRDAIRNIKRAAKSGRGVTLKTLAAIAPALKTTPQWLMSGEGKAEVDELLEMVPFDSRTTLSVPDTIEAFTWAILALLRTKDVAPEGEHHEVTEAEARILARAVVRVLRMPETLDGKPFGPDERRKLIETAVHLFRYR